MNKKILQITKMKGGKKDKRGKIKIRTTGKKEPERKFKPNHITIGNINSK